MVVLDVGNPIGTIIGLKTRFQTIEILAFQIEVVLAASNGEFETQTTVEVQFDIIVVGQHRGTGKEIGLDFGIGGKKDIVGQFVLQVKGYIGEVGFGLVARAGQLQITEPDIPF